jgi:hypothetical protein
LPGFAFASESLIRRPASAELRIFIEKPLKVLRLAIIARGKILFVLLRAHAG